MQTAKYNIQAKILALTCMSFTCLLEFAERLKKTQFRT